MSEFERVKWKLVKDRVIGSANDTGLKSCFGSIQDATDVYVRQYKFQEKIFGNGELVTANKYPDELRYAKIPLGIILNNAVEVHYENNGEEIYSPVRVLRRGDLIGLFETLDFLDEHAREQPNHKNNYYLYSATAGANSILPSKRFANPAGLQRILDAQNRITDVRDLIHAAEARFDWNVEILYFPRVHIENRDLMGYLLKLGWCYTRVLRHMHELNAGGQFVPDNLRKSRKNRNQRRDTFVANVVRELYQIGLGELPCFVPVSIGKNSIQTELGPFGTLYDILREGGDRRLEFLVPGYLSDADFGCYPASVCRYKKILTQGLLGKSCAAVVRAIDGLDNAFAKCGIGKDQLKQIPPGGQRPNDAALRSFPFEVGRSSTNGADVPRNQSAPKPLYVNSVPPIAGSIIITKRSG